jgi:FG-GAP-like repeat
MPPAKELDRMLLSRVSAISLFLFLCATADAQSPSPFFVPPSYLGNGQTVSADFNGDGKPDLVAADGTVLLGKGDGTFTTGIPLSVPGSLIATGDFNGDGKPDVLIVSFSSTNLYIFLGNGDGTFRTPVITNMGTSLSSVVVADLNGDGKLDVLGTIPGTALLVLLGKGDGTFGAGVTYPVLSNSTNFLAVGDFNADGKVDIALAANSGTSAPGSVGVLLGKGDGTFQAAVTSTGVSNPVGMAAGDFNGDGKLDLLVSDSTTGQTFLLAGKGNGTFQTPTAATSIAGLLATADVNGDGKPDAIIVTDPLVAVFLGKGDGTFTAENTYHVASEGNSESITIGDFNGDGRLDVALDNTILLGNGDGSFQVNAAISLNNLGLGPGTDGDFRGLGWVACPDEIGSP